MENDIQKEMATFIAQCQYDQIDPELVTDMKYRILDWLGCAITGMHYPQIKISRQFFVETGGIQEATILGVEGKYPAANAAMVNGMIGHVSELDDGHRRAIGHPGSVTLPVALALAEKLEQTTSTQDFLKALLVGYDLFIRMGQVINPSHYTYWHTTGTCGAFAATATAASIMKLTPDQTSNALGIVATMASGLITSFGTHSKALNIGHACQSAIIAASLAKRGFTGSSKSITGENGFLRAMSTEQKIDFLTNFSEETLSSNTAFYKVYASCGHTNAPLDLLFKILKEHPLDYREISRIDVETYRVSVALTGQLKTENEDAAKFSLPYCLAIALIFGTVSLEQFGPQYLSHPDVLALGAKINITESSEATARFPKRQATMHIALKNNKTYTDSVLDSNDEIEFSSIENKFFSATTSVDPEQNINILNYLKRMDQETSLALLFEYIKKCHVALSKET